MPLVSTPFQLMIFLSAFVIFCSCAKKSVTQSSGSNINRIDPQQQQIPESDQLIDPESIDANTLANDGLDQYKGMQLTGEQNFSAISIVNKFIGDFIVISDPATEIPEDLKLLVTDARKLLELDKDALEMLGKFVDFDIAFYTNMRNALLADNWTELHNTIMADQLERITSLFSILIGEDFSDGDLRSRIFLDANPQKIMLFFEKLIMAILYTDEMEINPELAQNRVYQNSYQSTYHMYLGEDSTQDLAKMAQIEIVQLERFREFLSTREVPSESRINVAGSTAMIARWLLFDHEMTVAAAEGGSFKSPSGLLILKILENGWEFTLNPEQAQEGALQLTNGKVAADVLGDALTSKAATGTLSDSVSDSVARSLSRKMDNLDALTKHRIDIGNRIDHLTDLQKKINTNDLVSGYKKFNLEVKKSTRLQRRMELKTKNLRSELRKMLDDYKVKRTNMTDIQRKNFRSVFEAKAKKMKSFELEGKNNAALAAHFKKKSGEMVSALDTYRRSFDKVREWRIEYNKVRVRELKKSIDILETQKKSYSGFTGYFRKKSTDVRINALKKELSDFEIAPGIKKSYSDSFLGMPRNGPVRQTTLRRWNSVL